MLNFKNVQPVDLGALGDIPVLPTSVFQNRFKNFLTALETNHLEAVCVYADREHAANMLWLTGFAPRFEEALLVVVKGRKPVLLLGNENMDYAHQIAQIDLEIVLYQDFSLPDQDRSRNSKLETLLQKAGLASGMVCATIGWKPMSALELPHWIAEAVSQVTGRLPSNATHLLMSAEDGLRSILEPEMILFAEYAARVSSQAVYMALKSLKIDVSERETSNFFLAHGLEQACHPMVNFGQAIPSGLGSPRNRLLEAGGYAQLAFGVLGSLTCRAGRTITRNHPDADDYLGLLENYLSTVRTWYASLRVGGLGSSVLAATQAAILPTWQLALNPGHLISYDEWLSSPFKADGTALRSGMAIQQDLIPIPKHSPAVINMEDGLVLADANLRAQLEPSLLQRCQQRRAWMAELGYELHEDVLPLSDIAGICFPFLLEPNWVALVN
jgi:hypothetical protein